MLRLGVLALVEMLGIMPSLFSIIRNAIVHIYTHTKNAHHCFSHSFCFVIFRVLIFIFISFAFRTARRLIFYFVKIYISWSCDECVPHREQLGPFVSRYFFSSQKKTNRRYMYMQSGNNTCTVRRYSNTRIANWQRERSRATTNSNFRTCYATARERARTSSPTEIHWSINLVRRTVAL